MPPDVGPTSVLRKQKRADGTAYHCEPAAGLDQSNEAEAEEGCNQGVPRPWHKRSPVRGFQHPAVKRPERFVSDPHVNTVGDGLCCTGPPPGERRRERYLPSWRSAGQGPQRVIARLDVQDVVFHSEVTSSEDELTMTSTTTSSGDGANGIQRASRMRWTA